MMTDINKYLQHVQDPNVVSVLKIIVNHLKDLDSQVQQIEVDLSENVLDTENLQKGMTEVRALNDSQDNDLEDLRRDISALETKVFYGDDY